jgi:hypothetical protein
LASGVAAGGNLPAVLQVIVALDAWKELAVL